LQNRILIFWDSLKRKEKDLFPRQGMSSDFASECKTQRKMNKLGVLRVQRKESLNFEILINFFIFLRPDLFIQREIDKKEIYITS
jgi:hypothetical protein